MEALAWGLLIGLIGLGLCIVRAAKTLADALRYYVDNVRLNRVKGP